VILALSFDSREKVDEIVRQAVSVDGSTYNQPRITVSCTTVSRPDGHIWKSSDDPSTVQGQ
jgi:predicted lactoylglutathione lyase